MTNEIIVSNNKIKADLIIVDNRPLYALYSSMSLYLMKKKTLQAVQLMQQAAQNTRQK